MCHVMASSKTYHISSTYVKLSTDNLNKYYDKAYFFSDSLIAQNIKQLLKRLKIYRNHY